jgi:hypothetical protein
VLGQVAQEARIGPPALQQFARRRVHLGEAVVAEHDVEVVVGIGERAGHVVHGDVQLGFPARDVQLGPLALGDVGIGEHQPAMGDGRVLDVENTPGVEFVFQLVRPALAHPLDPGARLGLGVARAIVAAFGVEAVELDDVGARPAHCARVAAQHAEGPVARHQLQLAVEDGEAEAQRIQPRLDQGCRPVGCFRRRCCSRRVSSRHGAPPRPPARRSPILAQNARWRQDSGIKSRR